MLAILCPHGPLNFLSAEVVAGIIIVGALVMTVTYERESEKKGEKDEAEKRKRIQRKKMGFD